MARKGGNPNLPKDGKHSIGNVGGGRKPDWFKAKMASISSDPQAIKFLKDVIRGEAIEEKTILTLSGETIKAKVSPSVKDRLSAWEKAAAYGFGKPLQNMEVTGKDGKDFYPRVINVMEKSG